MGNSYDNIHGNAELFWEWETSETQIVEKIKTDILCLITLFSERRVVCEIMWKIRVEPDTPYMTIQHGACALHAGITKARIQTHIHNLFFRSALQLFVSFGLLNYFFPLLPLLRPLFPIAHPHLPQIIPHIVFPSYSWPSLRSCCIRFPFVYGLGNSFISHSFYMP